MLGIGVEFQEKNETAIVHDVDGFCDEIGFLRELVRERKRSERSGRPFAFVKIDFSNLINVLKGDMSLVGPRPPLPYEVVEYDAWHKRRVYEAKPGITGHWQVYGRSTTTFNTMVRMDLQYIKRKSLAYDLKLIFQTAFSAFKGAY
ncbi:MAG: hypothetical protein GF398_10970 [Chitinivibrionales bacterium]|nr:hypothetical protein [Chitinivibrionales bacterium]